MKNFSKWMAVPLAFSFTSLGYAAAFQYYELGTPVIGTAAVGQAALANDASTAYFNPAGMTQLSASQYMVGSEIFIPFTDFKTNSANTISGDEGGNAASVVPGMALFYVYHLSPKIQLGVSFTSPYNGILTYNNGWVGRYITEASQFYTLNLNPSMAFKVNEWAAIGIGFAVEYANLYQTVAFPLPLELPPPLEGNVQGEATIKAHDTAVGFNVGLLFTPTAVTKIGLAYRSQITHNLSGNTAFLRTLTTPPTTTQMVMPQNIILSLNQKVHKSVNLLAEAGWANWSKMHDAVLTIDGLTEISPLDWKDTYRVGVGLQYQATKPWLLQTGVSYDSSPTSASRRTPNLPMDGQYRIGLGTIYHPTAFIQMGFSYEFLYLGEAKINNVSSRGTLSGAYNKNYANVLQASINVTSASL